MVFPLKIQIKHVFIARSLESKVAVNLLQVILVQFSCLLGWKITFPNNYIYIYVGDIWSLTHYIYTMICLEIIDSLIFLIMHASTFYSL